MLSILVYGPCLMSFPLAGCSKRDLKDSCALALPRSPQQLQLLHSLLPSSHPNEDGGRTRKELIEWDGGIFQGRPLIPLPRPRVSLRSSQPTCGPLFNPADLKNNRWGDVFSLGDETSHVWKESQVVPLLLHLIA